MIARYKNTPDAQAPADVLAALAQVMSISADKLVGFTPLPEQVSSGTYRLPRRLRKVEDLPSDDQKIVVKLVDALVTSRSLEDGS